MTITLSNDQLAAPGQVNVKATNPAPGGGSSTEVIFTIFAQPANTLADLPVSFPVRSEEMLNYFNQEARPDDCANIAIGQKQVLDKVLKGQTSMVYPSWAQAEQELSSLVGKVDIIGYNPEHWEYTPLDEQNNLPAVVKRASELAHSLGFTFLLIPDRKFAELYLREMAPYADQLWLQGQRIQSDPLVFQQWMSAQIQTARAVNPTLQILVAVGTTYNNPTAEQMYTAIQTIQSQIDGIGIWTTADTFSILQAFMALIRP